MKSRHFIYTLLVSVIVNCTLISLAIACDFDCKKASNLAVIQYGSKVEKAESKNCKIDFLAPHRFRLVAKSCKKDVRSLNIRYERYSALIKNSPEIKYLRIRHLELNAKLAEIEKLASMEASDELSEQSNNPLNFSKLFN